MNHGTRVMNGHSTNVGNVDYAGSVHFSTGTGHLCSDRGKQVYVVYVDGQPIGDVKNVAASVPLIVATLVDWGVDPAHYPAIITR
jgi:hypothetical protein